MKRAGRKLLNLKTQPAAAHETQARPRLVQVVTVPGSAWALMRGQLSYLRERGFDVTVISAPGLNLQRTAEREGVSVIPVPMVRHPAIFRDLRSLASLTRTLRRLDPDIVHFSTPKAGLLGSLAAKMVKAPIRLYTLRGMRADGFDDLRGRVFTHLERIPCRIADRVICVSESLRDRAEQLGISDPKKLCVLSPQSSNGIDCTRFSRSTTRRQQAESLRQRIGLPPDVPVIAFVGRLSEEKGVAELVEAFTMLRKTYERLHLLLVGPDESYRGLSPSVTARITGDPQVISTGLLDDTAPAYLLADVLALPTYREGFPNVVLEAAAMEVPVVATRVTGCVDAVVDDVTGSLVPERNPEALAAAIQRYFDEPELCKAHGQAARQRAESEFQPEQVWKSLFELYVEMLESRGLPTPRSATTSGDRGWSRPTADVARA